MKLFARLLLAIAFIVGTPTIAGETDPLFVNLTTNEPYRANVALTIGKSQLERGHPLTIFFSDMGVVIASRANSAQYAEHHKVLLELMKMGATVYVCPRCMTRYGVKEADLLEGSLVSDPELIESALFKDNGKTLSW